MLKTRTVLKVFLLGASAALWADDLASIQKALNAKFSYTTTTADHSNIVTAGSVLVLKKSNLCVSDASKPISAGNTYKNGRITQPKLMNFCGLVNKGKMEGARSFVSGEKIWVTGIEVKEKEITFNLFTDPFSDVRYRGHLNFPLEKDATPTVQGVMASVAEVFDIDASGGGQQDQQQQQPAPNQNAPQYPPPAPVTPPPPIVPPPPIAPPPPLPAEPKVVKIGQTPAQVTAAFGQPDKMINLGAKKIYVYKDMKIVFVGGKVSDVQ